MDQSLASGAPAGPLNAEWRAVLRRQKYQIVGSHSAVKKCRWLHESLVRDRVCYKQSFYGINSHRCIQMTPSLICNMRCRFCWRVQPEDIGIREPIPPPRVWDGPEGIVEGCLSAQRRILSGYKALATSGRIDGSKYSEALEPRHVAISLDGEPTLYPEIGGLLEAFRNRGFTTFLVTNGTVPSAIAGLEAEPTQLYVSAYAPDEEGYGAICNPRSRRAWRDFLETLELLHSLKCPTVLRMTLVKGLNMADARGWAELIERASPTYVEAKAYMYVGYSRLRLSFENMPTFEEVMGFASELAGMTSYGLIGESRDSRVALLSELEEPIKIS